MYINLSNLTRESAYNNKQVCILANFNELKIVAAFSIYEITVGVLIGQQAFFKKLNLEAEEKIYI